MYGPKKRVAVAKDVLKQLRLKKYIATRGLYFEPGSGEDEDLIEEGRKDGKDLQEILPKITCRVCAKGAILASRVNLYNEFPLDKDTDIDHVAANVSCEVFGESQANLIEVTFEGYTSWNTAASKFHKKYKTSEGTLRGIMNNIIKNNGVFKP